MQNNRIDRIVAVIDYIEAHLSEKLDLGRIAGAAHYSKYHLHRMFTQTVGLTIHDYLQRRQLTEAAKLLVFSSKPILEIALRSGYESQQAFTDVFTAMYKMPPYQFREAERFYPLQCRFVFEGSFAMLNQKEKQDWEISFATEADIPGWMELVRLVVDGFPCLNEKEYLEVLRQKIHSQQALILKDGPVAIGIMLFSYETGSIDFLGCHPLYRNQGIPNALLNKVLEEMLTGRVVSITTYREGDRADTGQRSEIIRLGFAEAELLTEYGYPTQRFLWKGDDNA